MQGSTRSPFGWTLPRWVVHQPPHEVASWLESVGVSWIKYPCWVAPEDTATAERIAELMNKLQEAGIQTVGMLDVPPESERPKYQLRTRREMVASQLFRDVKVWEPLLEPVLSRLTLKVRTWQLGGERDFSFLGRPRLRESVEQISKGLQGYGQPIDVVISWPWLESTLPPTEAAWQAVCRSVDPPLGADELDQFLSLEKQDRRHKGPSTWILIDPISQKKYRRDDRIQDLVLRMATVRGHRVEAAWLSDPYDADHGVLRPDGRPGELLLPWRTTSRLIGGLRKSGSLRLQGGSDNAVFVGTDRAVLMLWSSQPTQEKLFLGDDTQLVDAWGRIIDLPTTPDPTQPYQTINVGKVPVFVTGVDPVLLAFRMSVDTKPTQFDSLLGEKQKLKIFFTNPTRESMVGTVRLRASDSWAVENPCGDGRF